MNMSLTSALIKLWQDTSTAFSSSGYSFFCIEANLVCAIILIIILNHQQSTSDQTEAGIVWVRLLFVQIIYCISWILRVLDDVNILPGYAETQYIFTAINLILFSIMCWLVFVYAELYQKSTLLDSLAVRVIIFLPCACNIIMLILSPFTGLYFDISTDTMTRGTLYPLMITLSTGYAAVSTVTALIRRHKMTRYQRENLPLMAVYPAFFAVFGAVQVLNWKMPVLCFAIVIADIFVYISYADSLILTDPLTQIPNKNGLIRHLSSLLGRQNLESLYVFAVDVDDLSAINSSHGRLEGDKVLVLIAKALTKFSHEEHPCYISRYHSDEFIITAEITDSEELDLFIEHIRNYVNNAAVSGKLSCHVRVSIGLAKYEQFSRTETISGLLEEADRSLAERREQRKFQTMWHNAGQE